VQVTVIVDGEEIIQSQTCGNCSGKGYHIEHCVGCDGQGYVLEYQSPESQ
jgi:DnaJ-class molecular chaperone